VLCNLLCLWIVDFRGFLFTEFPLRQQISCLFYFQHLIYFIAHEHTLGNLEVIIYFQISSENARDYAKSLMRAKLGVFHQALTHIIVFRPSPFFIVLTIIVYLFQHVVNFVASWMNFEKYCEAKPDPKVRLQSRVSELEKKLTERKDYH
jgi:hypothetical protein